MSYDLDQFVSDCRAILTRDGGPKGREEVRVKLEQLLANTAFVEAYCGEQVPRGLKVLYEGSNPGQVKLKPVKKYRLLPGHAGIYQDGTIHSIDYPDYARFVRVTGTNLDKIKRVRFDLASGKVEQMTPQQAT